MPTPQPPPTDLKRATLFYLGATVLFSCSDAMSKYATTASDGPGTPAVPAIELASIRYVVFVLIAVIPLIRSPHLATLESRRPALQVARGLGVAGSAIFFILALGRMPIAEATAINFINPLLITLLAIPVLGERVTPRAWIAIAAGFLGMLVIVRPGFHMGGPGGFQPAALLVLGCSLSWSAAMLCTRRLVGIDRSTVTVFWTAASGMIVLLALLPFFLRPLTPTQIALCIAVGIVASAGQLLAVLGYRHAPASVLAPLSYAQLIWSSALGWLVFGNAPDTWTVTGGLIIAISGVCVLRFQRPPKPAPRPALASPAAT